jgi:hypothetical protein
MELPRSCGPTFVTCGEIRRVNCSDAREALRPQEEIDWRRVPGMAQVRGVDGWEIVIFIISISFLHGLGGSIARGVIIAKFTC